MSIRRLALVNSALHLGHTPPHKVFDIQDPRVQLSLASHIEYHVPLCLLDKVVVVFVLELVQRFSFLPGCSPSIKAAFQVPNHISKASSGHSGDCLLLLALWGYKDDPVLWVYNVGYPHSKFTSHWGLKGPRDVGYIVIRAPNVKDIGSFLLELCFYLIGR